MVHSLECTLRRYGCKVPLMGIYEYFGHSSIIDKKIAEYNIMIETKFGITKFNPIINIGNDFILPRYLAIKWVEEGIITKLNIKIPEGDKINILEDTIKPMKHQEILEGVIMSRYFTSKNIKHNGFSGCMVKLATGLGKTHLGCIIMQKLGVRTCIIVPNIKLATQWADRFTSVFPKLKVGVYRTGKKIWGDIMIIVGKSVLSTSYKFTHKWSSGAIKKMKVEFEISSNDFWNKFGCTIFDEAHTYCTPKYRKIFMIASTRIMLGLSATPEYSKYEKLLGYYIGDILDGDAMEEVQNACVNFEKIYTPIFYTPPKGYEIIKIKRRDEDVFGWSETVSNILSDPYRLELVCQLALDMYNEGESIFIFTDRKQIFPLYKTRLKELGMKKIYTLVAETTELEQQTMEKKARIVLGTYQACGTGLSIDHMTCMILASPRKQKFKQILGRILRIKSDATKSRTIYDLVDRALTFQYKSRKKEFIDDFGCKLSNSQKISYEEIDIDNVDKLDFNYM